MLITRIFSFCHHLCLFFQDKYFHVSHILFLEDDHNRPTMLPQFEKKKAFEIIPVKDENAGN